MTKRQEEIEKVSRARHLEKYNQEGFCPDFTAGAQWADKTMIEKACEFIKGRLEDTEVLDDYRRIMVRGVQASYTTVDELIEDFKEAMEE